LRVAKTVELFPSQLQIAEGLQLSRKWHATDISIASAQTIALQNERNEVDILRRRMDASVLLIKALGGG